MENTRTMDIHMSVKVLGPGPFAELIIQGRGEVVISFLVGEGALTGLSFSAVEILPNLEISPFICSFCPRRDGHFLELPP